MANKDAIIHVAILPDLKRWLEKYAKKHDVSVSSLCRVAISKQILVWREEDSKEQATA